MEVGQLGAGPVANTIQTTLTDLTPGTEYTITVAAVNGAGVGERSDSVVGMTETG